MINLYSEKNKKCAEKWAVPLKKPGLSNFYKVSDILFRGAQPKKNGFKSLEELGIKTVVNLRLTNSDKKIIKKYKLKYYHIPVNTIFPKKKQFNKILTIIKNKKNQPVFIHCRHGSDRTGTAVALYRIYMEKWNTETAIDEMVNGDFGYHKIHWQLKRFIRKFR